MAVASEEADSSSQTAACKHMKSDLHVCDMCVFLRSCYIIHRSVRAQLRRQQEKKCCGSRRKCSPAPIQTSSSEVSAVVVVL